MFSVSEEEFQDLMESSMENIPESFKSKMENIVFIAEPYPSENDLAKVGLTKGKMLLGLYSGTPYTHRNTWYAGTTPDRILLFQKNIEAVCNSKEELKLKWTTLHSFLEENLFLRRRVAVYLVCERNYLF